MKQHSPSVAIDALEEMRGEDIDPKRLRKKF
jgi:hypothetical protein